MKILNNLLNICSKEDFSRCVSCVVNGLFELLNRTESLGSCKDIRLRSVRQEVRLLEKLLPTEEAAF